MEHISEWRESAKCKDTDTDYYFPNSGNSKPKEFCTGCPVIDLCKTYAIAHDEDGIWGGTSYTERKRINAVVILTIRDLYHQEGLLEYRPGVVAEFLEQKEEERRARIVPISLKAHVQGATQALFSSEPQQYTQQNNT